MIKKTINIICFSIIIIIIGYNLLTKNNINIYSLILLTFLLLFIFYNNYHKKIIKNNKITILALHLGIGGIEQYIYTLSQMLKDDYDIEIISTYNLNNKITYSFDKKIKIRYLINDYPHKEEFYTSLKNKNILLTIKNGIKLFKILLLKHYLNIKEIRKINSKYIITTRSFHNRIVSFFKNKNIIAIATEHNYHNNDKKYINNLIKSCINIDYLVLVSEDLQSFYEDKFKNKKTKCLYIPNVIEKIPPYKEKNIINYNLVSIGRLSYEKGFDDLIDIIEMVKEEIPQVHLDIYGDGSEKNNLKKKINDMNLKNNITICGFYPHEELIKKLPNYDIYVMTSYTESFGIVLLEAMSNSVPCIAFDSANGAKILLKDNRGVLVRNRDKNIFSSEIITLLKDKEKINTITKKAYDYSQKYDINRIKNEWLKMLKKISK